MSGGRRYWNEDTQRWEDGDAGHAPGAETSGADVAWWQTQTRVGEDVGPMAQDTDGGGVQPFPEWPADTGRPFPAWVPQPSAPAAAGGLNRRVLWSVVVGAAAVGVAVSLVLSLVVGSGDEGDGRPTAASASTTPGPTRPTDASEPPSPTDDSVPHAASPSALPAGYVSRDDGEGFRIAVPEGWSRSTVKSSYGIRVVNYRSADHTHRLQVYQVAESSPDASFQLYLSSETAKPAGFQRVSLENLDDGEFTGSRLEYLADTIKGEPAVGTWHVYDERFVAVDGNIYAIAAYGPDADGRDDELELLTTALNWFCPPGAGCDPAAD